MIQTNQIIFLLIFAFNIKAFSQKNTFACNYYGKAVNEKAICSMFGFQSRPEAIQAVENIVKRSGLKQNFYIMECPNIDNCFAVTREGERMIIYDASFMKRINTMTKTDWGALSVLAHEIGHHLQGHTLKEGGSDQQKELEADEFSGFVMYQMGASINEAQSAIMKLTTDYDGGTHPPRNQRLKAIETGFKNAENLYPNISGKKRKTPNEEVETKKVKEIVKTIPEINKENEIQKGCINGNCKWGYGIAVNRFTLEKYAGEWNDGKRSGTGIEFYNTNEKKYEGNFNEGKYDGKGIYYFKNGDIYKGGFKNGEMHGNDATYFYKKGDILQVDYVDGKKEGIAKIIYQDGNSKKMLFKNDQLIR